MRNFIALILAILFFCMMIMFFVGHVDFSKNDDRRPAAVTNFR